MAIVSGYAHDKQQILDAIEKAKVQKDDGLILVLNGELLRIEEARKDAAKEESARLDKFLELLGDSGKKPKDAEKEAFDVDTDFYLKIQKAKEKERRMLEAHKRKVERERRAREAAHGKEIEEYNGMAEREEAEKGRAKEKQAPKKKEKNSGSEQTSGQTGFAQRTERQILLGEKYSLKQQEALFAKGYKRLKISPYGDSGASYYWVMARYNESKEHAFFCYLIEAELKKYGKRVEMNVNNGPDIVFEHNRKKYCFDVETGKNYHRHPEALENKFHEIQKGA